MHNARHQLTEHGYLVYLLNHRKSDQSVDKTVMTKKLDDYKLCESSFKISVNLENCKFVDQETKCRHKEWHHLTTNKNQKQATTIYSIDQNYFHSGVPCVQCRNDSKDLVNPLLKAFKITCDQIKHPIINVTIPFVENDPAGNAQITYVKAYPLIIGSKSSKVITLRMARVLSNTTLKDPTQG